MMGKHLPAFCLFVLFSMLALAETADELYKDEKYPEAKAAYEKVFKETKDWHAAFRIAETEAMQHRYAEAAQFLATLTLPPPSPWRSRLLFLRTQIYDQHQQQYGWRNSEASVEGTRDVTRWSREQWDLALQKDFAELFRSQPSLTALSTNGEKAYLQLKEADLEKYPTLWNLVVERGVAALSSRQGTPKRVAYPSKAYASTGSWSAGLPPAEQAARLYASASKTAAGELWSVESWLLPLTQPSWFRTPEPKSGTVKTYLRSLQSKLTAVESLRAKARLGSIVAVALASERELEAAVTLCRNVEKWHPQSQSSQTCIGLRSQHEAPELSLRAAPLLPDRAETLAIRSRNVKRLFYRWLPIDRATLKQQRSAGPENGFHHLRTLEAELIRTITKRKPLLQGELVPRYPKKYEATNTDLVLTPQKAGLYALLVADHTGFDTTGGLVRGLVVTVSNLTLLGSASPLVNDSLSRGQNEANPQGGFHLYTLESTSGRPQSGVSLEALQRSNWQKPDSVDVKTQEGHALLRNFPSDVQSVSLEALAQQGNSLALLESPLVLYRTEPDPFRIQIDIDRPIYRQGQTVKYKVTLFERAYPGWKWREGRDTLTFTARNASGKEFSQTKGALGDRGSYSGEIKVPTQGMLGSFSLEVKLEEGGRVHSSSVAFQVEDYKRPELEVTLDDMGACRFSKPCEASGKAVTYAGTGIANREVRYRVTREPYFIFWESWWRTPSTQSSEEIKSGTATTDAKGKFRIPFTPLPFDEHKGPGRFRVTAEVQELGGRTISAQKEYSAGFTAYVLKATPSANFYKPGQSAEWKVVAQTLNGETEKQPADLTATWSVAPVVSVPPLKKPDDENGGDETFRPMPEPAELDGWLANAKVGAATERGTLKFGQNAEAPVKLSAIAPGLYLLSVSLKDKWGGTVETKRPLVVVNDRGRLETPLKVPALAIARTDETAVGTTVDVLLGSALPAGPSQIEVWQGRHLIQRANTEPGIQTFSFPVEARHRGGLTVRWFSVSENRVRTASAWVKVPWTDRELALTWNLPATTEPGKEISLDLTAKSPVGDVRGEGTLRVLDRSLESYAGAATLGVTTLFPDEARPDAMRDSHFVFQSGWLPVPHDWLEKRLGINASHSKVIEKNVPAFLFESSRMRGHFMVGRANFRGAAPEAMLSAAEDGAGAAAPQSAPAPKASNAMAKLAKGDSEAGSPTPAPAPRKDFSETAAFLTQVAFDGGKAKASVKFPDSLTSWKAELYTSTADGRVGYVQGVLTTQKPISVELSLSRFLREGDTATFRGVAYNNTKSAVNGTATFTWRRLPASSAANSKPLSEKTWPVKLEAEGQTAIPLPVPAGAQLGDYELTFTLQSTSGGDSIVRDLSILPSRQVLVASDVALLEGEKRAVLSTTKLGRDTTLKSSTFAIEPNLVLSVLGALPYLATPPALSLDALLYRYVPAAAMQKLFEEMPELKKLSASLRDKKPNRSAWNLDDPRRQLNALESPWALEAEGASTQAGLDLLDPKVVDELSKSTRDQIKTFQLENGAFTWFPGGRDDLYMTLTALATFLNGSDLGVNFDEEVQRRATAYVMARMQEKEKLDENHVTLSLYAAYVVAGLSEKYAWAKAYVPSVKNWLAIAEKNRNALTPLGRAYAARAYFSIGDTAKANQHLDRVLASADDDPITGLAWKIEEFAWTWYRDGLEKHLFVLRTLLKVRPDDKKIASLVRGLFWQKKGTHWKSPRHSAEAVLAMVTYLKQQGAFQKNVSASWTWGAKTGDRTWKPLDTDEKAVLITENAPKTQDLTATVDKKGPGLMVTSLTTLFESSEVKDGPKLGGGQLLEVDRKFYRRQQAGGKTKLLPLKNGDAVQLGDVVEVEITLKSRGTLDYLYLKSPRGAGFEPEEKLSGWRWDGVSRYQEIRDSVDQIFISWMPRGTYRFRFPLRATTGGTFHLQSALAQSMYSPDVTAYSPSAGLTITP